MVTEATLMCTVRDLWRAISTFLHNDKVVIQMIGSNTQYCHDDTIICGVDEAGRGPLAGRVYAACVILGKDHCIEGLDDSNKLSAFKRSLLAVAIKNHATAWAIASASVKEIASIQYFAG